MFGGVSEADTTVLQHVDLDGHPATQQLYFRYDWDTDGQPSVLSADDRSLHIDAGLTVSFNTYFNSFYAGYWKDCTSVSTVALRVQLAGRGAVTVSRQSRDGAVEPVGDVPFDSATATTVEIRVARTRRCRPRRRGGCGSRYGRTRSARSTAGSG